MTRFIKIVAAHVSEGMCWNIKGFFKYCFQRRMSPNGSFRFLKLIPFLNQNIFSHIFNYLNSESRKLCWDFSVAKQVDAQWLGMWICAFSALCTCFVCRDHLTLWPHKWHIFPGCKHLVGGGCPDSVPPRNAAAATQTWMKPQSRNCKYFCGVWMEVSPIHSKCN